MYLGPDAIMKYSTISPDAFRRDVREENQTSCGDICFIADLLSRLVRLNPWLSEISHITGHFGPFQPAIGSWNHSRRCAIRALRLPLVVVGGIISSLGGLGLVFFSKTKTASVPGASEGSALLAADVR